jgi:hypothetical protein
MTLLDCELSSARGKNITGVVTMLRLSMGLGDADAD